jgi:hypothetical protein
MLISPYNSNWFFISIGKHKITTMYWKWVAGIVLKWHLHGALKTANKYCPRSGGDQRDTCEYGFFFNRPILLSTFPHRALVNAYKLQPTPGVQKVGISLFFTVVDYVSDETQRHPPTRQFFTSCIEILGQVRLFSIINLVQEQRLVHCLY